MNPRLRLRHDTFDNFDIKLGILNKISETKFSVGCILYGLAVMQTISNSTNIKNIDKIKLKYFNKNFKYETSFLNRL